MSAVPLFHGRISPEGRFELADAERAQRQAYFRTLAGKNVEIIVRKERLQRSLDQNAYIHAVPVPLLADHCGYSITEMKLLLMGECFGWHTVGGHELPLKPHTSDMTVDECRQFIDWVIPWAMEHFDVAIPLPNEVAA
jgi:hypothetical protein